MSKSNTLLIQEAEQIIHDVLDDLKDVPEEDRQKIEILKDLTMQAARAFPEFALLLGDKNVKH